MIRRPALHFDEQFTTMPNAWLRDPRTTFATKGFLAHLLSHRPGWRITLRALAATYPEGIAALQTIVRNAVDTGYLVVTQQRDQSGRFAETNYDLCDPFTQPEESAGRDAGFSGRGAGNPCTENPYTENPHTKKNIFQEDHLEELSSSLRDEGEELDEIEHQAGPLTPGETLLVENMLTQGAPTPKIVATLAKQRAA